MRLVIFLLLAFCSCAPENKTPAQAKVVLQNTDSIQGRAALQISFEKDDYVREELAEKLKPISINFKKINSIKEAEWMSVEDKKYSEDEWQCEAYQYKYAAQINKIIVRKFGKKSQQLQEHYLINEKISLLKESEYNYEDKELLQTDSYFINEALVYQFDNQDCGAPNAQEYNMEEGRRISGSLNALRNRFSVN